MTTRTLLLWCPDWPVVALEIAEGSPAVGPVDERWWAPAEASRRARFQVCLADGTALLLSLAGGRWSVEAIYD